MTELRKPCPKYGWRGVVFPVGARVLIKGRSKLPGPFPIGRVIEFGTPPPGVAHMTDLVHLLIEISPDYFITGYPFVGYTGWWNEWQLELIDE